MCWCINRAWYVLLILLVWGLDYYSKEWILGYFATHSQPLEISSYFHLVLVYNKGATFGLLNNDSATTFWILTAVVIFVLGFLVRWLVTEKSTYTRLALSMIIGGALGNLYDRLIRGAVVDFLDFFWQDYHWPAFNVADAAIVTGVGLLILKTIKER